MAKVSGGTRNNRIKRTTEKNYSAKMVRNIVGMEQKYRHNKDETLHIFNAKGDIVNSIKGEGARVRFNKKREFGIRS